MSDPHRLVRSRLNQVSRRALAAAITDEPPADAKASVWRAIGLALPASGVVLGATASTSAATTSQGPITGEAMTSGVETALGKLSVMGSAATGVVATAPWVFKAVATGVAMGVALGAVTLVPGVVSRGTHPVPAASVTDAMASPPRGARSSLRVAPPSRSAAPADGAATISGAPAMSFDAPVPEARFVNATRSLEGVTPSRSAMPPADTLREESQLLVRVRQALSASDGARALSLLAEHRRVFGAGTLTQERDVMAVQALVQLGRMQEAKTHAKSFLQKYPASPHGETMRAIVER